jgi:predicted component of type VI protein secretion system
MAIRLVAAAGWPDILVDRATVVVGRHPHCDCRLVSPRVSRWHCCLFQLDDSVWVRDLGSTNGIWINSQRVSTAPLGAGDVLSIAHIAYRLENGQVEPARMNDAPRAVHACCDSSADPPETALHDECVGQ